VRAVIKTTGIVQGVGFRPFIYRIATANRLKGFVRNRADAVVEIAVEGTQQNIDRFLEDLKTKTPPAARLHDTIVQVSEVDEGFTDFRILQSSPRRELSGSTIPADIATCDECLSELRNPRDPRHDYFFITCTNCGPRYTTIRTLPYDRQNTTMQAFKMCRFCEGEYEDPANRRFHAQTTACPSCGPRAYLVTNSGEPVHERDPIRKAGRFMAEGAVLGIKGYGGFHLATATTRDDAIQRLRTAKHRSQKPFAVMARDLAAVRSFAAVDEREAQVLSSLSRPIVLLDKLESFHLSALVAPGLHNVGVFLPYTGMHVMLFDQVQEPAFVMTSANPPSEPIVIDNDQAVKELGLIADYFLLHDRQIAQRCDDSVVRITGGDSAFIRRSRGYAPEPLSLRRSVER
jgi:hydrogenase maturation protein HypF